MNILKKVFPPSVETHRGESMILAGVKIITQKFYSEGKHPKEKCFYLQYKLTGVDPWFCRGEGGRLITLKFQEEENSLKKSIYTFCLNSQGRIHDFVGG